ncbi:MAG: 4-alpha-glucanotransferase [Elusimicrobia bacterium]|nr:4-alpha-glucanotransferase [Elusimicrobiota bacterium]
MGSRTNLTRCVAAAIGVLFFSTNCLWAYSPETNIWAERRKGREQRSAPTLLASLPDLGSAQSLGGQFPSPNKIAPSFSQSRVRSVPKNFMEDHAELLRAISPAYGTLRQVSLGPKPSKLSPVIVHIQDVHQNLDAQKNIGRLVGSLVDARQSGLIALEGTWGDIQLQPYRDFTHRKAVEMSADYLLKQNKISGPIHAALTGTGFLPPLIGIEDPAHYNANVEAYRQTAPRIEPLKKDLAKRKITLAREKNLVFSTKLKVFDAAVESYHENRLGFGAFVEVLADPSFHLPLPPSIRLFQQTLSLEKTMDFRQVENERTALIHQLIQKMDRLEMEDLTAQSVAYRSGEMSYADFYRYLKNVCSKAGFSLESFPAMGEYIRYVLLADGIDAEILLEDLMSLERSAYAQLANTPEARTVVQKARFAYLAGKLVDFSLTPEEWKEYRSLSGDMKELSVFEAFYREADFRDRAMAANLLKAMREGKSPSPSILVTGGYHTPGLTAQLTQAGATVLSVVPKIEKLDTAQGSTYLSVFTQEKTPLDQLFKGEKLFLAQPPIAPPVRQILLPVVTVLALVLLGQTAGIMDLNDAFHALGGLGALSHLSETTAGPVSVSLAAGGAVFLAQASGTASGITNASLALNPKTPGLRENILGQIKRGGAAFAASLALIGTTMAATFVGSHQDNKTGGARLSRTAAWAGGTLLLLTPFILFGDVFLTGVSLDLINEIGPLGLVPFALATAAPPTSEEPAFKHTTVIINVLDAGSYLDGGHLNTKRGIPKAKRSLRELRELGIGEVYLFNGVSTPSQMGIEVHTTKDRQWRFRYAGNAVSLVHGYQPKRMVTEEGILMEDSKGSNFSRYDPAELNPNVFDGKDNGERWKEIQDFAEEAHRWGIKVKMDLVLWMSPDAITPKNWAWAESRWRVPDEESNRTDEEILFNHPGHSLVRWSEGDKKVRVLVGNFGVGADQVKPDFANPDYQNHIKEYLQRLVDAGVDGVRVDMAHLAISPQRDPEWKTWSSLIHEIQSYAAAKGAEFHFLMEAYREHEHFDWRDDFLQHFPMESVYDEKPHQLLEKIVLGDPHALEELNRHLEKLGTKKGQHTFFATNYDDPALRNMARRDSRGEPIESPQEAFLALALTYSYLKQIPFLVEWRDLSYEEGQNFPQAGGEDWVWNNFRHPFLRQARRGYLAYRRVFHRSPRRNLVFELNSLFKDAENVEILDNNNRERYFSFAVKTKDGRFEIRVFDFYPQKGAEHTWVAVPQDWLVQRPQSSGPLMDKWEQELRTSFSYRNHADDRAEESLPLRVDFGRYYRLPFSFGSSSVARVTLSPQAADQRKTLQGRPLAIRRTREALWRGFSPFYREISRSDFLVGRPDVFLLLGNPDLKTFLEFAKRYIDSYSGVPIVLAGGRGSGTRPLLARVLAHYNISGEQLLGELKTMVPPGGRTPPRTADEIEESFLLRYVLTREGIPSDRLHQETEGSRNTELNFINSQPVIARVTSNPQPRVAVVTRPISLTRIKPTAERVTRERGYPWRLSRFKVYDDHFEKMTDGELIDLVANAVGYPLEALGNAGLLPIDVPEKGLSSGNELWGIRTEAGFDFGGSDKQRIEKLQTLLVNHLKNVRPLRYDPVLMRLEPMENPGQNNPTGGLLYFLGSREHPERAWWTESLALILLGSGLAGAGAMWTLWGMNGMAWEGFLHPLGLALAGEAPSLLRVLGIFFIAAHVAEWVVYRFFAKDRAPPVSNISWSILVAIPIFVIATFPLPALYLLTLSLFVVTAWHRVVNFFVHSSETNFESRLQPLFFTVAAILLAGLGLADWISDANLLQELSLGILGGIGRAGTPPNSNGSARSLNEGHSLSHSLSFLGFRTMGIFAPLSYWRSRSDWGVGDFDTFAQVVAFAKKTKQRVLQILPLQYPTADNCPYAIGSSYILDPVYIGLEDLFRQLGVTENSDKPAYKRAWGLRQTLGVRGAALAKEAISTNHQTRDLKLEVLQAVFQGFKTTELDKEEGTISQFLIGKGNLEFGKGSELNRSFKTYCVENAEWLADHLVFFSLSREFATEDFSQWPKEIATRDPQVLEALKDKHREEILFGAFVQWIIARQMSGVVRLAREGEDPVDIMLDQPFAFGSADVWTHLPAFHIDPTTLKRDFTQGVPPHRLDIPQHWQFTLLKMNEHGKQLLLERLRYMLRFSSILRIDHLLGYYELYYMMEDTRWEFTLANLGIWAEVERVFKGEGDPAEKRRRVYAIVLDAMRKKCPDEIRRPAFDGEGHLHPNGVLLAARRSFSPGTYDRTDKGWYSQNAAEHSQDLLYTILTPPPLGKIDYLEKLIREEGQFLRPTDSLRLCFFNPGFGEEILSSFMAEAQRQGKTLVMENLGAVPPKVTQSLVDMGASQFKPLYFGFQRFIGDMNDYWFDRVGTLDYAYFGFHDTVTLRGWWTGEGKWSGQKYYFKNDTQKWGVLEWLRDKGYLSRRPDVATLEWSRPLQEGVLSSVADSQAGTALFQAPDLFGSGEEGIINIPGQSGFWTARAPVPIEDLMSASESPSPRVSTVASDVVELILRLSRIKARHSFEHQARPGLLATRPPVGPGSKQVAFEGESFLLDASYLGTVHSAEVVFSDGRRWAMTPVGNPAQNPLHVQVFHASIPAETTTLGTHAYQYYFNGQPVSEVGYLVGIRSGTNTNPLSATYGQTEPVPPGKETNPPSYDDMFKGLEEWLKQQRWFLAKSSTWDHVRVSDHFVLSNPSDGPSVHGFLIQVRTSDGPQTYYVPLLLSSTPNGLKNPVAVSVGGKSIVVAPAEHTQAYQRALFHYLSETTTLTTDQGNRILFEGTQATGLSGRLSTPRDLMAGTGKTSSNVLTEVKLEETPLVVKTLKRVGGDTEPEMYAALAGQRFPHMVAFRGGVVFEGKDGQRIPLCLVIEKNNGPPGFEKWEASSGYQIWTLFSHAVQQFLETGDPNSFKKALEDKIGSGPTFGELISVLGETIADLHIALAASEEAGFGRTSATPNEVRSRFLREAQARAHHVLAKTAGRGGRVCRCPPRSLFIFPESIKTLGSALESQPSVGLSRVHGDMQLDQIVLGPDYRLRVLDFGGAPLSSLEERRRKTLPADDVAGLLRAFGYIKYAVLNKALSVDMERLFHLLNDPRAEAGAEKDVVALLSFADQVEREMGQRLVDSYLKTIEKRQKEHLFLPHWDSSHMKLLIDWAVLSRALYELEYEVSARPDEEQAVIPLETVVRWGRAPKTPTIPGPGHRRATSLWGVKLAEVLFGAGVGVDRVGKIYKALAPLIGTGLAITTTALAWTGLAFLDGSAIVSVVAPLVGAVFGSVFLASHSHHLLPVSWLPKTLSPKDISLRNVLSMSTLYTAAITLSLWGIFDVSTLGLSADQIRTLSLFIWPIACLAHALFDGGTRQGKRLLKKMTASLNSKSYNDVLWTGVGKGMALMLLPLALLLLGLQIPFVRAGSPGPIFYFHPRAGHNGRQIKVLKIRTMTRGNDPNGPPYLTPFGRVIRPIGLDEIPQIFSIITGKTRWFGARYMPNEIAEIDPEGSLFRVAHAGILSSHYLSTERAECVDGNFIPLYKSRLAGDLKDVREKSVRYRTLLFFKIAERWLQNLSISFLRLKIGPWRGLPVHPIITPLPPGATLRIGVSEKAFAEDGLSVADINRRENHLLVRGQPIPVEMARQTLENIRVKTSALSKAVGMKGDPSSIGLATSNVGVNTGYFIYRQGKLFRNAREKDVGTPHLWLGTTKGGETAFRTLRFQKEKKDWIPYGENDAPVRDLAAAFRGPVLIEDGTPAINPDEWDDIRHLFRLPVFSNLPNFPGGGLTWGLADGKGELHQNADLRRRAFNGEAVTLSLEPLGAVGLDLPRVEEKFREWGYQRKKETLEVKKPGDYFMDELKNTATVRLLPGFHPHTVIGEDKDKRLVVVTVLGETNQRGADLRQLAAALAKQGVRRALMVANGKDVLVLQASGQLAVKNVRRKVSALLALFPPSGSGPSTQDGSTPSNRRTSPDLNQRVESPEPKDVQENWQPIRFYRSTRTKSVPTKTIEPPLSPIEELEKNLHLEYGAYTPAKWASSQEVVDRLKAGDFDGVRPVTVQLVPSLACNYHCGTCSYGKNKDEIRAKLVPHEDLLMSLADMKHYIDDLAQNGVKGIVFTGGGEPLLNPNTIEGLRYAKAKGLDVGLFTNGSYLNEKKIRDILSIGLSFLRVSLNAGTPQIHQLFHGLKGEETFHAVIANLKTLARVKSEMGQQCQTGIDVGVIISPLNVYDLAEVAKRVKEIDDQYPGMFGNLSYRPTVNYVASKIQHGDSISRTIDFLKTSEPHRRFYEESVRYFRDGEQFSAELFQEALKELEKAKTILKDNIDRKTISVVVPTARIEGTSSKTRAYAKCLASPLVVFVVPNGTVYGCVELAMNDELILGNLKTTPFLELWASEKRKAVMSFLKQTCVATMCPPVCMLYEYNRMFNIIAAALDAGGPEAQAMRDKLDSLHKTVGATVKGVSFMFPMWIRRVGFEEQTPEIRLTAAFNEQGEVNLIPSSDTEGFLGADEVSLLTQSLREWASTLDHAPPAVIPLLVSYNTEAVGRYTPHRIEINRALLRAPKEKRETAQNLLNVVVWHEGYHLLNPSKTETQATLATAFYLKDRPDALAGVIQSLENKNSFTVAGPHFHQLSRFLNLGPTRHFQMSLRHSPSKDAHRLFNGALRANISTAAGDASLLAKSMRGRHSRSSSGGRALGVEQVLTGGVNPAGAAFTSRVAQNIEDGAYRVAFEKALGGEDHGTLSVAEALN